MSARIRITLLFAILLVLPTWLHAQLSDPAFYLVDNLDWELVSEEDQKLINQALNAFHREKVDTQKVKILHELVEACNDGNVWPKYNDYMLAFISTQLRSRHDEQKTRFFKRYLASAVNNQGYHYKSLGDIKEALKKYEQSLKIDESIGNNQGIAMSYNNLASIYQEQGMYNDALTYYERAQDLSKKIGARNDEARALNNIGSIYVAQGKMEEAILAFNMSAEMHLESKDVPSAANAYNNLGFIYRNTGDFVAAAQYFNKALQLSKTIGDKPVIVSVYINLGVMWYQLDELTRAKLYADSAYTIAEELGYPTYQGHTAQLRYKIYEKAREWEKAFFNLQSWMSLRDSITNEENKRQVERQQLKYQYEKRQAVAEAEYESELLLAQETQKRQGILNWFTAGLAILIAAFAVFVFTQLRKSRRQNLLIEEKNEELNASKQKVEQQNREMVDSIEYAKRIQQALLQSEEHVTTHLPEHFILFIPKDILSGDFYWAVENGPYWYVAAADCTGHGVPGALLTMLGNSFLNEIIRGQEPLSPSETLDVLRDKVVKELSQKGEDGDNRDGMDISLSRINLETLEVEWAGAFNPLWIVRNGSEEIEEVKANRQPIGHYHRMDPFTNHKITLNKGDSLYMMSDGFADQLGGKSGKKFRYKPLKELIVAGAKLPLKDQQKILEDTFRSWKGDNMQIDDVCIIGIKV